MTFNKVHFSSAHDNWSTPTEVKNALYKEFDIQHDPCPLGGSGGLIAMYRTNTFINPPYSSIKEWVKKSYEDWIMNERKINIVMLIPSRTDTRWWHEYVMKATEIRFIKGRLKFGNAKNSAPFPSCIVIFKGGSNGA